MSTLSPQQTDRQAWNADRVAEFSASTNADLLTEPRTLQPALVEKFAHLVPDRYKILQSGQRKGMEVEVEGYAGKVMEAAKAVGEIFFGMTAKTLIATKATEAIKGSAIKQAFTYPMKRGTVLEPTMKYLLSQNSYYVCDTPVATYGVFRATPDGLRKNDEPVEIKCPNEVDVLRFSDEVPDGDWEALKAWNKKYAYQIATQAAACGTTHANLIYCTDEIKTIPITEEQMQIIQGSGIGVQGTLIGDACEALFQETGQMFEYEFHDAYDNPGFTFVARRFEIPAHEIALLERVLRAAYAERDRTILRYRRNLSPTPEEVGAVAELIGEAFDTE